jgi:erythromycin esterase-like protein
LSSVLSTIRASLRRDGQNRFLLKLTKDEALRRRLLDQLLERFLGVIYRPDAELFSHYASASIPQQFDALVWFDETRAATPLGPDHANHSALPDTYPFRL